MFKWFKKVHKGDEAIELTDEDLEQVKVVPLTDDELLYVVGGSRTSAGDVRKCHELNGPRNCHGPWG